MKRPGSEPIRVMIVDDHAMVAESLRRVVDDEPDMCTVRTAYGAREAEATTADVAPDVVLIDLCLPDGDGLAVGRVLRRSCPEAALVLLTDEPAPPSLAAAFDAGFRGHLDKSASVDRLVQAIRQAAAGEFVLAPAAFAQLVPGRAGTTSDQRLTGRELEVLRLVAEGLTNKDIAARLVVSLNTVRKHVQSVLTKIDAHSKLEAVIIARRRGLIDRF